MALWIVLALMCAAAVLTVTWPLYRQQRRISPVIATVAFVIVGVAVAVYAYQGSPDTPSADETPSPADIGEMVAALAARLEDEPNDTEGWKLLGRSYLTLNDYDAAVRAFEKAVALEQSQNAQTLVDLGGAMLARDDSRLEAGSIALFESALALEPNNPAALFYGGLTALQRGNTELAADRWEILLALNPPDNVRAIIEAQVVEWRGDTAPAEKPQSTAGTALTVAVSADEAATSNLPPDTTVYLIARDPQQPSPPIAVARRTLAELPATIQLDDGDAMIPGRELSAFEKVELIARISISGEPVAQSGDWFASIVVETADTAASELHINQRIP